MIRIPGSFLNQIWTRSVKRTFSYDPLASLISPAKLTEKEMSQKNYDYSKVIQSLMVKRINFTRYDQNLLQQEKIIVEGTLRNSLETFDYLRAKR
jgi:hypothetical protein